MGEVIVFDRRRNCVVYEKKEKPWVRKFEVISSGRLLALSHVMWNKVFDIMTWDFYTERLLWVIPKGRKVLKFERRNTTD